VIVLLVALSRLRDFSVKALLTDKESMMCAYVGPGLGLSERRLLLCKADVYGHKVKIQMGGDKERMLIMCEVEVHGHYG